MTSFYDVGITVKAFRGAVKQAPRSSRLIGDVRGDAGMAGVAAGESVTIAGRPERVAVARAFAAAVLGRQHPAGQTAVLLVSELVTNSVRHSASGLPGQTITVTVLSGGEVTQVQVTDRSGTTMPALRPGTSGLEGGGRDCTWWTRCPLAGSSSRMAIAPQPWFELQHG
jgi:hypothetical protein